MDPNLTDADTGEQELPKRQRQAPEPRAEQAPEPTTGEARRGRTDEPLFAADEAARVREVAGGGGSLPPTPEQPLPATAEPPLPPTSEQARPAVQSPLFGGAQAPPRVAEPSQPANQQNWRRPAPVPDPAITAPTPSLPPTPLPTNIYRARRPGVAILLILPAIGFGFLIVRALAISAFGRPFVPSGVVASGLMLAAIPLLVSGLYGLITGAAHGAEQWGFRVWARPPLAYLLVGLALSAAAGLALG